MLFWLWWLRWLCKRMRHSASTSSSRTPVDFERKRWNIISHNSRFHLYQRRGKPLFVQQFNLNSRKRSSLHQLTQSSTHSSINSRQLLDFNYQTFSAVWWLTYEWIKNTRENWVINGSFFDGNDELRGGWWRRCDDDVMRIISFQVIYRTFLKETLNTSGVLAWLYIF